MLPEGQQANTLSAGETERPLDTRPLCDWLDGKWFAQGNQVCFSFETLSGFFFLLISLFLKTI